MALSAVPFALQNAAHSADLFREAVSSLVPNQGGIVQTGDMAVTQTGTPSMAVQVGVGRAWIKGTEAGDLSGQTYGKQGLYYALNDAPVTRTITAANATNPRIDLVCVYVKDQQYSGTSNLVDFIVVAGTPATTPVAPTAPANSITLAQVAVAANATSITNANITSMLTGVPVGGGGSFGQIAAASYSSGTAALAYNFLAIIADVTTPWVPANRKLRITLETDGYMSASSSICAIGMMQGGTTGNNNGTQLRNCAVSYQTGGSTESSDLTFHYTTAAAGPQRFYVNSTSVTSGSSITYPANARRITVYDDGAA